MSNTKLFTPALLLSCLCTMASGVSADTPPAGPPTAMPVEVTPITMQSMRMWETFSGRLQAVDQVEIKPRVSGYIQQVMFEDGAMVEQGDLLFVIDPRPFEAEIARIQGQLQAAVSRSKLAGVELKRIEELYKDKVVPKRDLDNRTNDQAVANADIAIARAQLAQARLDLEYSKITAPIDGRISRAEFTEGNLLETMMGAPVLTTIVSVDRLYAEFDIDEQTYIRTLRNAGQMENMPVEMTLASDDSVVYQGEMYSFDNQINTSTGTIRARAIFTNRDGLLIPGMYAKIRLGAALEENFIVVDEAAIGTDQNKKFIYIVNDQNQAEYHEVRLGKRVDNKRILYTDLPEGTQVITSRIQMIQPGAAVQPIPAEQTAPSDTNDG